MKNGIYVDIDTERENPIVFGKPPDIKAPETREEAQAMVLNDIASLSEALALLILMAHENQYGDKMALSDAAIKTIAEAMTAKPLEAQSEETPPSE